MPWPDPHNREGRWPEAKGISCSPDTEQQQTGRPRLTLTPWLYYKEVFSVPHAFFGKYCNPSPPSPLGKEKEGPILFQDSLTLTLQLKKDSEPETSLTELPTNQSRSKPFQGSCF